jgi:hypothetical protein
LLEDVIPKITAVIDYEVELELPCVGRRADYSIATIPA